MLRSPALFFAFLAAACVSTDPDRVELTATVDNVDLAVEKTTLVTVLSGQFDLVLALGDLASGNRVIDRAPALTLVKAADHTLVRNIDALPEGDVFPLTIRPGDTRTLTFTLTNENTLHVDQFDAVCSAPLIIFGSTKDSETGHTVSFQSEPFTPMGCP